MEKSIVIIDARRTAYSKKDVINHTCTVRELIEQLEQFDDDSPVILSHDNGYTYGEITYQDFDEQYLSENED